MTHDKLDVYGFLKHYRDGFSWSDPDLIAISTKDAMDMLETWKIFGSMTYEEYNYGRELIREEFDNN